MIEPNEILHYIFTSIEEANKFYYDLITDTNLPEEYRNNLSPPRQAHFNTWVIDKLL